MAINTKKYNAKTVQTKLKYAWFQFRYLKRTANMIWTASQKWTIAWLILLVFQGLLPIATVLLTKSIVDGIVKAIAAKGSYESIAPLFEPIAFIVSVFVLMEVISGTLSWVREHQAALIEDHIAFLIHEISTTVDLEFYETPEYFDHLHRARKEAWYRPQQLVDNIGLFAKNTITLIAMSAVLFSFSIIIPFVLLASTVPALYVVLRHALKQHKWRLENTERERKAWYYDHEMTVRETAAELRLFDLGNHYREKFKAVQTALRKEKMKLFFDKSLAQTMAGLIALIAVVGCLGWMGWRTLHGMLTMGELALFYVAFRHGQQMMSGLLSNMGNIYKNILFLGDLFEFLDLKPQIVASSNELDISGQISNEIKFVNVDFAYPKTNKKVLENFSLNIAPNKITAIVGENGVGKSTLLKLICKLYNPQNGQILLGENNLQRFNIKSLRKSITVLFQSPVKYNEIAHKNIAISNLDDLSPGSISKIKNSAIASGANDFLEALPNKYNTMLGKWFKNGSELSHGEWQKVALARAFLRDAPIVLLDEPTSSMDSWAEAKWMDRLKILVRGKTTLIITHRFTTAKQADVIYVMYKGKIVESGNHDELLILNGRYAKSWNEQAFNKKK